MQDQLKKCEDELRATIQVTDKNWFVSYSVETSNPIELSKINDNIVFPTPTKAAQERNFFRNYYHKCCGRSHPLNLEMVNNNHEVKTK